MSPGMLCEETLRGFVLPLETAGEDRLFGEREEEGNDGEDV